MENKKIIIGGGLIVAGIVATIITVVVIFIMLSFATLIYGWMLESGSFYKNSTSDDGRTWRLPVNYPYVLSSHAEEKQWSLNDESENSSITIKDNIKAIGVIDFNKFVVVSQKIKKDKSSYRWVNSWDIIDVLHRKDTSFDSKNDYYHYVSQLTKDSITMYNDITNLYINFRDTKTLPPEWPK
jgi:hypothetical protein